MFDVKRKSDTSPFLEIARVFVRNVACNTRSASEIRSNRVSCGAGVRRKRVVA